MDRLSFSTFGVVRTFMALAVFFCHVFPSFNDFGFLFVSVFFFMSGYGMEFSHRRDQSLSRLFPYLLFFFWYSFIYLFFFHVWPYPSSWFLVVYFLVMLLYRLFSNIYALLCSFVGLAMIFTLLGFNWVWYASFGAFLFGVFFARRPSMFTLRNCFLFVTGILLFPFVGPSAFWSILPLFSYLVISFLSLPLFRPFAFMGSYTFHFYCVHCLVLGLFGCTWTLGGVPSLYGCIAAFFVTVLLSIIFTDCLFKYPKVG